MARIDLILVVALGSVLIVQNCCAAFELSSLDRYLDLPDAQLFGTNEEFNKNIRDALVELHVEPESNFGMILDKIKTLAKSRHNEHKETYECLDIICGYDRRDFPYSCVYDIKSIVTQVIGQPNSELGKLNNFLKKCTENYFSPLVKSNMNVINNGDNHAQLLDKIFKGAFEFDMKTKEQPGLNKDVFLAESLKGFNLADGKMNVRNMVDAAKGLLRPSKISSKLSLRPLIVGMNQGCVEMQYKRYVLDLIMLYKTIKGEELKSNRLEKLFEYQRICMDWQDTSMRTKILEHMRHNL